MYLCLIGPFVAISWPCPCTWFLFSKTEDSNDEFFHGGKSMHWLPVGLSLFATTFSSNSFVGLPAEGAFRDYHQLLAILFIPFIVIPITCKWFIPLYKSWKFDSLYEYFEERCPTAS